MIYIKKEENSIPETMEEDIVFFRKLARKQGIKLKIYNHLAFTDKDIPKNSINIYCSYAIKAIKIIKKEEININTQEISSVFYDDSRGIIYNTVRKINQKPNGEPAITLYDESEKRTIGIYFTEKNSFLFTDITHSIDNRTEYQKIINFIKKYAKNSKVKEKYTKIKEKDITIGSDIEFITINRHGEIERGDYFGDEHSRRGADGWHIITEIRPQPFNSVKDHIKDIKSIIKEFKQEGYRLTTYSYDYPTGCHIHVGVGRSYTPDLKEIKFYNYFLGNFVSNLNYRGSWNSDEKAIESKPYGFEYRKPSSSILVDMKLTEITFKLMKKLFIFYHKHKTPPVIEHKGKMAKLEQFIDLKLLTESEAKYFIKTTRALRKYYEDSDKEILHYINDIKKIKHRNKITVDFVGSWRPEQKDFIKKYLSKKRPSQSIYIQLISLHESRGRVSNPAVKGITKQTDYTTSLDRIAIPYEFIKNDDMDKILRIINKGVKNLYKHFKEV